MRGHVGAHVGCGGGHMLLRPDMTRGSNLGARGTCMVTWQSCSPLVPNVFTYTKHQGPPSFHSQSC